MYRALSLHLMYLLGKSQECFPVSANTNLSRLRCTHASLCGISLQHQLLTAVIVLQLSSTQRIWTSFGWRRPKSSLPNSGSKQHCQNRHPRTKGAAMRGLWTMLGTALTMLQLQVGPHHHPSLCTRFTRRHFIANDLGCSIWCILLDGAKAMNFVP